MFIIEQIFECAAAYSISLENMNTGVRKLEFKSWFYHLLAL